MGFSVSFTSSLCGTNIKDFKFKIKIIVEIKKVLKPHENQNSKAETCDWKKRDFMKEFMCKTIAHAASTFNQLILIT